MPSSENGRTIYLHRDVDIEKYQWAFYLDDGRSEMPKRAAGKRKYSTAEVNSFLGDWENL